MDLERAGEWVERTVLVKAGTRDSAMAVVWVERTVIRSENYSVDKWGAFQAGSWVFGLG